MGFMNRNVKNLKEVIFEIAKKNGATLSDIGRNTELEYQTVKNQVTYLSKSGLINLKHIQVEKTRGKGIQKDSQERFVEFKSNIETFKTITKNFDDDKELSKFMQSKYYQDNVINYRTNLINSMEQNKLYPLPDIDYFEYGLRNSPSVVRDFLIKNDLSFLIFNYNRYKWLFEQGLKTKLKPNEMSEQINYPIWDEKLFFSVQSDASGNTLLNSDNGFAHYFPPEKIVSDNKKTKIVQSLPISFV